MNPEIRIVHYINQFFGQLGGEEQADTGFLVKEGPVGPGVLLKSLFGDEAQIVATVICGDNYFAQDVEKAVEEGLKLIAEQKPNLFVAGPAFNAGRYGIACGAIASAVKEKLNIPVVTGMFPENPAAEIHRKNIYIAKTGISAGQMKEAMTTMVSLARKQFYGQAIGSANSEGYIPRGVLYNEFLEESSAVRGIKMLLAKIKGEPFQTELVIPEFEEIPPAPPIKDISKAKIALVSDGGLVPKGNPDHIKASQNTIYKAYEIDTFINNPFAISHSGYHPTEIRKNINRLLPVDVLREMESEGVIGNL
jgi:betaine reductase